jgi:hypothetical protein
MIAAQEKFLHALGFKAETVQLRGVRAFVGWSLGANPSNLKKNGGDDETRTRDLCRDRAAF